MIRAILARQRNRRILLASGMGVVQRVVQLVTTLITLPLVLHSLGVAAFGVWGAATSLAWLSGMLDLGLGSALLTLLPRDIDEGGGKAGAHVAAAFYGGCAITILFLVAIPFGLLTGALHVRSVFVIASVALALNVPVSIASNVWLGLQKGHFGGLWQLAQSVLTLGFLMAAALAKGGLAPMVASVYGAMLLANAGSLAHVLWVNPEMQPSSRLSRAALHTVLTQGGLMFLITVAGLFTYAFDNLMALDWLGPHASAQMTVVLRVCVTANGLIGVVTQPFWPGFAEAVATRDTGWMQRTLWAGTLFVLALSVSAGAILLGFGIPLLRWWMQADLHITLSLLWVMAAWITLTTLPQMPGILLHAALRLRPQVLIFAFAAAAGIELKYYGARHFGVIGILVVYPLLWLLVVSPAYFWLAADFIANLHRKAENSALIV